MKDEPQRDAFVQGHSIGSSSQNFLRPHRSAWTLDETRPVLTCSQRHIKSKDLLMLKIFVYICICSGPSVLVSAREGENLPQVPCSFALFIDYVLFFQFTSPGIGFKNRLPHLMPAEAREAKDVSFKFKGWLQRKQPPPPPSLQVGFALQRQLSIVIVNSVRTTNILHPHCGKEEWFLTFVKGDLPLYKATFF